MKSSNEIARQIVISIFGPLEDQLKKGLLWRPNITSWLNKVEVAQGSNSITFFSHPKDKGEELAKKIGPVYEKYGSRECYAEVMGPIYRPFLEGKVPGANIGFNDHPQHESWHLEDFHMEPDEHTHILYENPIDEKTVTDLIEHYRKFQRNIKIVDCAKHPGDCSCLTKEMARDLKASYQKFEADRKEIMEKIQKSQSLLHYLNIGVNIGEKFIFSFISGVAETLIRRYLKPLLINKGIKQEYAALATSALVLALRPYNLLAALITMSSGIVFGLLEKFSQDYFKNNQFAADAITTTFHALSYFYSKIQDIKKIIDFESSILISGYSLGGLLANQYIISYLPKLKYEPRETRVQSEVLVRSTSKQPPSTLTHRLK